MDSPVSSLNLPILETSRLLLRKLRLEDVPDVFQYNSDPEVVRYLLWNRHTSESETRADLQRVIERYGKTSDLRWGIELKSTGHIIGGCKLACRMEHKRAEIGYVLARPHWGQGCAAEAVREIARYGFESLELIRIEALTFAEHAMSGRVLDKCGFQFEGILRNYELIKGKPTDLKIYSLLRSEFEAQSKKQEQNLETQR